MTLNSYFNDPDVNYPLDFNDSNQSSIQVTTPTGTTTLKGSNLGLALTDTKGVYTLGGTLGSTVPLGIYTIKIYAHNDGGYSASPATYQLTIGNIPTKTTDPSALTLNLGQALSNPLTLSNSFASPTPSASGPLTMPLPPTTDYVEVVQPGSATPVSLADSALGGANGLSITKVSDGVYNLIGGVPATAADGTYQLKFKFANNIGPAADFATLTINVAGLPPAPVPGPAVNPAVTGNNASFALTNLASHFSESATVDQMRINRIVGQSGTFGLSIVKDNGEYSLAANPLALPTGVEAGTYQVQVAAHNAGGWSVNPLDVNLTIARIPTHNSGQNPGTQSLHTGTAITTVDMAQYFSEQNNIGTLNFNASNFTVTDYQGNPTTLAALGLSVSGDNLEGTLASGLHYGNYTIQFKPSNEAGLADNFASLTIDVLPAVPSSKSNLPNAIAGNGQSYTSPDLTTFFNSATPITAYRIDSVTRANGSVPDGEKLGLSFNNNTLTGTVNLGTLPGDVYTLKIAAENSGGWSSEADDTTLEISIPTLPTKTGDAASQNVTSGADITSVNLTHSFTESNGVGYLKVEPNNITVSGPDGSVNFSNLGLSLDVQPAATTLSGKFSTALPGGVYTINFKASNQAGTAAQSAQLVLNVTRVVTIECPNITSIGNTAVGSYTDPTTGQVYSFTGFGSFPNPGDSHPIALVGVALEDNSGKVTCKYFGTHNQGVYAYLSLTPGHGMHFTSTSGAYCSANGAPGNCKFSWTEAPPS